MWQSVKLTYSIVSLWMILVPVTITDHFNWMISVLVISSGLSISYCCMSDVRC